MSEKLISIVTVTFNASECLERTLISVKKNKKDYVEFLVVDGISTDGTIDLLKRYSSYIDSLVIESDRGIYDAQNKGVMKATGRYVYFLQAGDELEESIIEKIHSFLEKSDYPEFLYGNVRWGGDIYDGQFNKRKLCFKNICQQAIFYDRSRFISYGLNNLRYNVLADYCMNIMFWSDNSNRVVYMPYVIAKYDVPGYSGKNQDNNFKGKERFLIYKKLGVKYALITIFYEKWCATKKVIRELILGK